MPFTLLIIKPVNNKLMGYVESLEGKRSGEAALTEQDIESLIVKWNKLHAVRAIMTGVGAVAGLLAILW